MCKCVCACVRVPVHVHVSWCICLFVCATSMTAIWTWIAQSPYTLSLPLSLSFPLSLAISLFRFLPVEWKRLELGQAGSNKKSSAPLVILIPAESLSRKIAKGSQLGRCTWWTSKWTDGPTDRWKQSEEIQARPAQARAQTVGCGLTYLVLLWLIYP